MRHLLLVVLGYFLLSGCASQQQPIPAMPVANLQESQSIVVEDLRPKTEAEAESYSVNKLSEAFGIFRVAGEYINPPAPRLLAHRAFEQLPELLGNPPIKLYHLVVYSNAKSYLRKRGWFDVIFSPILAEALFNPNSYKPLQASLSSFETDSFFRQTEEKEYSRAFFNEEENPEKAPVHLIYIDTEILGKRVASRCFIPMASNSGSPYQMTEKMDFCIQSHLALYTAKTPAAAH